jgi:two-component system, NarL family, response regulator DevR
MTESRKTRVMLVDDHEIVRLGLMTLINDRADMEVVGEAGDAAGAVREAERLKPDVILMDIRMPGEGGIEATRQIMARLPEMRIVMLTSFADDELLVRAISAGAVGYVLKQVGNAELLRAIAAAARGEALLDPRTTARLLSRSQGQRRRVSRAVGPRDGRAGPGGPRPGQRRNRREAQPEREDGPKLHQHDV